MNPTDEQIEKGARALCAAENRMSPDEVVYAGQATGSVPRWRLYEKRARLCLTAALSMPEQEVWRDISTAPKDGTRFLALWGGKAIIAKWLDNSEKAWPWSGWRCEGLHAVNGMPQGWRPLPAPPLPAQEDDRG